MFVSHGGGLDIEALTMHSLAMQSIVALVVRDEEFEGSIGIFNHSNLAFLIQTVA
jgi:hypothetical protein